MLVAIIAYHEKAIDPETKEERYDSCVVNCDDVEGARELARRMSMNLIYEDGELFSYYENKALEKGIKSYTYEYDAFVSYEIRKGVRYKIYELKDQDVLFMIY